MIAPERAIWVRMPRFIGDALMIHRAVQPLRAAGMRLVAWGPGLVVDLFAGSNVFDSVVSDPPEKPGALALARLLRGHRPAAVVNLARSQRASAAAFLAGVPLRIGWSEGPGRLLNNRAISFRETQGHQMDRYRSLLGRAFPHLAAAGTFTPLIPRSEALREADRLLESIPSPFVALALGAACWNKRLGAPVWSALARLLLSGGFNVVLLGSAGEDETLASTVVSEVPGVFDLAGRTSLPVTAGIILRSAGLVGNDSALAHLATACAIPCVVAFGPTDPTVTAPLGDLVRCIWKQGLPCLPCRRMDCIVGGHPCMQTLEADRLLAALLGVQK